MDRRRSQDEGAESRPGLQFPLSFACVFLLSVLSEAVIPFIYAVAAKRPYIPPKHEHNHYGLPTSHRVPPRRRFLVLSGE
jgi:hypothetical protein